MNLLPLGDSRTVRWTKSRLVDMGKFLFESLPREDNSDEAIDRAIFAMAEAQPGVGSLFATMPTEQIIATWAMRWADFGFPVYQVGHKYGAALLATSAGAAAEDDLKPPFKAFLLELPPELLSIPHDGEERRILAIVISFRETKLGYTCSWVALTETSVSLWEHIPVAKLGEDEFLENKYAHIDPFNVGVTEQDQRVIFLIRRLIINTCLAVSSKDNLKPIGKAKNMSADQVRRSSEPLVRIYQVGQPLKVDCRQAVRDYVCGRVSKAMSVQVLVAGHWKRQPHGQGRTLRRWVHISPYWRGDEEAPVLVRPHVLGKERE